MNTIHGEYIVTVDENIIAVTMLGAFTIEGIKACIKEVRMKTESLKDKVFCLMSNILQLSGATPDANDEINKKENQ